MKVQFLKTCEDHNVIPKSLRFKVANSNLCSSSTYKWCQRKLLREESYSKKLLVSKLDKESKLLYNNVKSNLNLIDFYHFLNISLISNEKELEQIKFRHLSKLKFLIPTFTWHLVATLSHDPQQAIFNFLSEELSSSDKDFLSEGQNLNRYTEVPWIYLQHLKKRIALKPNEKILYCHLSNFSMKIAHLKIISLQKK